MEKIAIIGLSCLLPGAENPEQYWQNLIDHKNLTSTATAEQMGVDASIFYDPIKGKTDKYYCLNGGYIRDFQFDASGYQIAPELLNELDPIYQWPLYVSKQALQDSGYSQDTAALANCGVILGNLSFPTRLSHHLFAPIYQKTLESAIQTLLQHDTFRLKSLSHYSDKKTLRTGSQTPSGTAPLNALISASPATLITQSLSLLGPRLSLDAACASSLYTVKLACQYLLSGQADLMLAGAVSCADPFFINMGFSIFQAYPENGMNRPFDKSSDGLVAGEGAGMLVLKRYRDAIRDGDHIYATLRGIGLSNDGKGKFVLNPNPKGQIFAFERAYTDAGIHPNSIDYIECHATGTPVGDITELNSMEVFFGQYEATPLLGSVKSNLGHLLTAAGVASLIKVILSMDKGVIPPTIKLNEPLSSDKGRFSAEQMVRTTTPWPISPTSPVLADPHSDFTKRAGISAFGFGGTNAHMILDSFPRSRVGSHAGAWEPEALGSHAGAGEPENRLAIVGMDTFFGGCPGLAAFDRTIYEGVQHFIPVPAQRWQGIDAQTELLKNYGFEKGEAPLGAYIQDFELDFLHFKIPPRDDDQLIPQQLLMLKVTDNAIRDAGLVEGGNVAVIVAMETELALHQFRGRCDLSWQIEESLALANISLPPHKMAELESIAKNSLHPPAHLNQYTSFIGNIMACRIAALWDFTGPAFTVSAEENAVFSALEVAQQFLAAGEVDAVVVGAVDLAGGFESVLLRHQLSPTNTGTNTLSYDEKANGWMVGEGAGAVVLKRLDSAQTARDRIYAVIDAICLKQHTPIPSQEFSRTPNSSQEKNLSSGENTANNNRLESLLQVPDAETVAQTSQKAFEMAGITPTDIGYLEVCGSGIAPEDAAEIKGLIEAYQLSTTNDPLFTDNGSLITDSLTTAIGSVKANIGHTYAASGLASLIKTALCLYHRYIPAVPQWERPKMPEQWQGSPFYVATESKTWFLAEGASKRVAAINGLNLVGSYAHLILSENVCQPESQNLPAPTASRKPRKSLLKKITLGGPQIHATILTPANRKSFENMVIAKNAAQQHHLKITQLQIAVSQQSHNDPLSVPANSSHRQPTLTAQPSSQKPVLDLNAEVVLDSTIQLQNTPRAPVTEPRSIFLTGATGFLGTFLLYELLHQTQADIYCLVRSPNVKFGQMRIQNNLASYFSLNEDFHSRIVPVLGDLSKPLLGWSSEQFQKMANQIDTIYHCAAWLNWVAPYSQLKTINVLGTQEILRLAAHVKIKPVHYISTVAVFESSAYYQKVVTESDPLTHSEGIYLGYSQSKWVAEKLVMVARDRGFPVAIYRPPLISGHSQTGVWNTDDVTCKIIKGCIQMGYAPELNSLFDVVPVDYVSQAIVYLSKQPAALGNAFHLNNPTPLHHDRLIDFINSFGYPLRPIPYENWLALLNPDTTDLLENPLAPLLPFFVEKWSDTQLAIPQVYEITRKPQISYQNTLAKLVGTSIVCPPVDAKLLHTYFSYFIRSGFLDAPTQSADKSRAILPTVTGDVSEESHIEKGKLEVCKQVVWDEADLLEFAEGKIANVFGPEYAIIDSYSRRVQLPLPPYLLVSRVTKLNAERGHFKPSTITTEYDIPHQMWYSVDGQIPWAVAVESGQCDLLLISYLGIDFENKGILVYRLLDCTMTFLADIPQEGDTLRYDISINSFVRHGNNLLFFFSYECFVGDKMVLTMDGGCAGFFTDDELDKGKGVVYSKKELLERENIQKQQFEPLLICQKTVFDQTDMIHLTEGNIAACFGDHYWQAGLNPCLRVPPKQILMIDRVTSVAFDGGAYGLGLIIGEKMLEPEHWYFPCHFKDDQVMAGSLMAEGCGQLLQFYLLYLGFQTCTTDARFQPIPNLRQVVRCRGQVTPISATLIYRLEITELGLTPKPYAKGDVEIILDGKIVVHFKDVGLQLSENNPANSRPVGYSNEPLSRLIKLPRQSALLNEEQIQEFCLGSVANCFGPEYQIYDSGRVKASRMPNTHLNCVHRVLEVKGQRHQLTKGSTIKTEYDAPVETWYYRHNSNPTLPYSILMEIALQPCGFLAAYLGTTLLYPEESLYFRNLDGRGRILKEVDIRGKTVTNTARLLSTSNIQGMILQSFDFEMVCEGEPFYQGEASFGFFSSKALANQVGLDAGKDVRPWLETGNTSRLPETQIDLKASENRARFYQFNAGQPHYRLAQHQLDLLNQVTIVEGGGRYQQGYIYAKKTVKPTDWYFKCHFHQDPVMPGSLGIEAILQAMQVYALQLDLGKQFNSPRFVQLIDHETVWKYRGQIPHGQTEMYLEVHLSKVEISTDKVILIGDASLWKPKLRIYDVKNLAVCLTS